eukprot:4302785-Amphidinium_carterae.1
MSIADTFRLLGVEIGHTHSGEIMLERIREADSRLDRIMCLPGAPLSIKRNWLLASCAQSSMAPASLVSQLWLGELFAAKCGGFALGVPDMPPLIIFAWEFAT